MYAPQEKPSIITEPAGQAVPGRLIIADDHALIREGIRTMLANEPDLLVVGEAKNGKLAVELCRELRPNLVLMDVQMPEMDGLAATQAITPSRSEEKAREMRKAGAESLFEVFKNSSSDTPPS